MEVSAFSECFLYYIFFSCCKCNFSDVCAGVIHHLSIGQNIGYGQSSTYGVIDAFNSWAEEKKDFTYGNAENFYEIGHYTQVVTYRVTNLPED